MSGSRQTAPSGSGTIGAMDTLTTDAFTDLLLVLDAVDPAAPTRCAGWTVHDLVAHLAAGSQEIADLAEEAVRGEPPRPTRGFEEREAPLRALAPDVLRDRLVHEAGRVLASVGAVQAAGLRVPFTGADFTGASLLLHGTSELVLHRWDIVGDDLGLANLGHPKLTEHLVDTVAGLSPGVLPAVALDGAGPVTLRSPGQRDVVATAGSLRWGTEGRVVELPAGERLLRLWGRDPARGVS